MNEMGLAHQAVLDGHGIGRLPPSMVAADLRAKRLEQVLADVDAGPTTRLDRLSGEERPFGSASRPRRALARTSSASLCGDQANVVTVSIVLIARRRR